MAVTKRRIAAAASLSALALWASGIAAHAEVPAPQDGKVDNGIDVYMSAPYVQGSFISGGVVENFDSGCGSSWAMGSMDGPCFGVDADAYGGASTESGTPTQGGVGSPYGRVEAGDSIRVTLSTPSRYLGFWWTGGDPGNTFRFYSEGVLIAEYTTATVVDILTAPSITSEDGDNYVSDSYMSNPVFSDYTAEPYVYLHIFAKGNFTFDEFTFTHNREVGFFEFDNVVTSTSLATATGDLVYVSSYGDRVSDTTSGESGGGSSDTNSLADTGFNSAGTLGAVGGLLLVAGVVTLTRQRRALH